MDLTSAPPSQSLDIDLQALFDASPDEEKRVSVSIWLPNMKEPREYVYGCRFPVGTGDSVLCPPTPYHAEPFVGVVTSTGGEHYDGPLKFLIAKVS